MPVHLHDVTSVYLSLTEFPLVMKLDSWQGGKKSSKVYTSGVLKCNKSDFALLSARKEQFEIVAQKKPNIYKLFRSRSRL